MKGFIVLYKIKDEDAADFEASLHQKMLSESDPVQDFCGGDDYKSNESLFRHEL